jgi:small conductance mechanosensitive channel
VPAGIELEQVYQLINRVGAQLKVDCLDVLEPTQIEGLESFDQHNLVIRTMTRVKPGKHLHVPRLLRSKLKVAFDQHLAQSSPPALETMPE